LSERVSGPYDQTLSSNRTIRAGYGNKSTVYLQQAHKINNQKQINTHMRIIIFLLLLALAANSNVKAQDINPADVKHVMVKVAD